MVNQLRLLTTLIFFIHLVISHQQETADWLKKHLPSQIEYTRFNDVAIVYNTPVDFYEFWDELQALSKLEDNQKLIKEENGKANFERTLVREALAKYIFPRLVLDPVRPGDPSLYNAEYEHKKEVFGHKLAKDFIMRSGTTWFTKGDIGKWFQPTVWDKEAPKAP